MKTLYDLLGIERQATLAQIQQGYRHSLDAYLAQHGTAKLEDGQQLRAIAEAYRLLSSPTRRRAYDEKLSHKLKQRLEAQESCGENKALLWVTLLLVIALLGLSGSYYYGKPARNKERVRLEVGRAQAEAARVERRAIVDREMTGLAEATRPAQTEQARHAAPHLPAPPRTTQ